MRAVTVKLSQLRPRNFQIQYTPSYKTLITHYALGPQHPLFDLREREMKTRKKEGLWWHVTNTLALSKSAVVRSWCRRRLRNAFLAELNTRGFNQYGKLIKPGDLERMQPALSLTGSLRLNATPALVAAKHVDVRRETAAVIDILLEGAKAEASIPRTNLLSSASRGIL